MSISTHLHESGTLQVSFITGVLFLDCLLIEVPLYLVLLFLIYAPLGGVCVCVITIAYKVMHRLTSFFAAASFMMLEDFLSASSPGAPTLRSTEPVGEKLSKRVDIVLCKPRLVLITTATVQISMIHTVNVGKQDCTYVSVDSNKM